jgi:hypothetical protein
MIFAYTSLGTYRCVLVSTSIERRNGGTGEFTGFA